MSFLKFLQNLFQGKVLLAKLIKLIFQSGNKTEEKVPLTGGALLDIPDNRDYILNVGTSEEDLPEEANLCDFVPYIKNQSYSNACVLFSLCSNYEIMARFKNHPRKDLELSEMFAWYVTRKVRGWEDKNTGTYPRDAAKEFQKGFTLEQLCPFVWHHYEDKPQWAAYIMRSLFKIRAYYRIWTITEIKTCILGGIPVSITLPTKLVAGNNQSTGYHQVSIVGYNNNTQKFLILNSWGRNWDEDGYCELDYNTIEPYLVNTLVIIPDFWN